MFLSCSGIRLRVFAIHFWASSSKAIDGVATPPTIITAQSIERYFICVYLPNHSRRTRAPYSVAHIHQADQQRAEKQSRKPNLGTGKRTNDRHNSPFSAAANSADDSRKSDTGFMESAVINVTISKTVT